MRNEILERQKTRCKDKRDIEIRETGDKSNERHKKPEMKNEKDKIQER